MKNEINTLLEVLNANEDLADLVEDVKDVLQLSSKYVACVAEEEESIAAARFMMEGAAYRAFVQNVDRNRRIMHEALMSQVNMLNRICGLAGVAPVADVDVDDRESYYAFAKKVVDEYFTTGAAGSATNP